MVAVREPVGIAPATSSGRSSSAYGWSSRNGGAAAKVHFAVADIGIGILADKLQSIPSQRKLTVNDPRFWRHGVGADDLRSPRWAAGGLSGVEPVVECVPLTASFALLPQRSAAPGRDISSRPSPPWPNCTEEGNRPWLQRSPHSGFNHWWKQPPRHGRSAAAIRSRSRWSHPSYPTRTIPHREEFVGWASAVFVLIPTTDPTSSSADRARAHPQARVGG